MRWLLAIGVLLTAACAREPAVPRVEPDPPFTKSDAEELCEESVKYYLSREHDDDRGYMTDDDGLRDRIRLRCFDMLN